MDGIVTVLTSCTLCGSVTCVSVSSGSIMSVLCAVYIYFNLPETKGEQNMVSLAGDAASPTSLLNDVARNGNETGDLGFATIDLDEARSV